MKIPNDESEFSCVEVRGEGFEELVSEGKRRFKERKSERDDG